MSKVVPVVPAQKLQKPPVQHGSPQQFMTPVRRRQRPTALAVAVSIKLSS
jgi:hypothetical protein